MGLSFGDFGKGVLDFASRAYDQINPWDEGRSFTTRVPASQRKQETQSNDTAQQIAALGRRRREGNISQKNFDRKLSSLTQRASKDWQDSIGDIRGSLENHRLNTLHKGLSGYSLTGEKVDTPYLGDFSRNVIRPVVGGFADTNVVSLAGKAQGLASGNQLGRGATDWGTTRQSQFGGAYDTNLASKALRATPGFIQDVALTGVMGPTAVGLKHGIGEGQEQLADALESGQSVAGAYGRALPAAAGHFLLGKYGTGKASERILSAPVRGFGGNVVRAGGTGAIEGAEEGMQQLLSNAIRNTYNPETGYFDGVGESIILGVLLGAGGQAGSSTVQTQAVKKQLEEAGVPKERSRQAAERLIQRAQQSERDKATSRLNKQLNPQEPRTLANDKKQMSDAERAYRGQQTSERRKPVLSDNLDVPAFQRRSGELTVEALVNPENRKQLIDRLSQEGDGEFVTRQLQEFVAREGMTDEEFVQAQNQLAQEYEDTIKGIEVKSGSTVRQFAQRRIDKEFEERAKELEDRAAATRGAVEVLSSLPREIPAQSEMPGQQSKPTIAPPTASEPVIEEAQETSGKPTIGINEIVKDATKKIEQLAGLSETEIDKDQTASKKIVGRGNRGIYQRGVDKAAANLNNKVKQFEDSDNKALRGLAQAARFVTNREFGVSQETRREASRQKGGIDYGFMVADGVQKTSSELLTGTKEERINKAERVHASLDKELARDQEWEVPTELSADEKAYRDYLVEVSDFVNELSYAIDMIGDKEYNRNKGGKYIPRMYTAHDDSDLKWYEKDNIGAAADLKLALGGAMERKKLDEIDQSIKETAIRDPGYLLSVRLSEIMKNAEVIKFGKFLASTDNVSTKPKPGFMQMPESKAWGELSGKYIRRSIHEDLMGFQYVNTMNNALYTGLKMWNSNPLRKGRKKLLTTANPGTRIVNRVSNSLIFAPMGGVNPVQHAINMQRAKKEINNNSKTYRELVREGVLQSDLTQEDIASQKKRLAQLAEKSVPQTAKEGVLKAIEKMDYSYGKVDDEAKLGAYLVYTKRGYTHDEAVKMVKSHYQNYRTVSAMYDIASKTPAFGNAFARFTGDFIRLAGTGAVRHPLRLLSMVAAVKMLQDTLSEASGEDEEDRKTREERAFGRNIPGTNISTEFAIPENVPIIGGGYLDISKFFGAYALSEPDNQELTGNRVADDFIEMFPFEMPLRRDKETGELEFNKQGLASDPLIGPLVQLAMNEDFKQDKIHGPDDDKKGYGGPYPGDQKKEAAEWLAWQYSGPLAQALENSRRAFLYGDPDKESYDPNTQTTYNTNLKTPTEAAVSLTGARFDEEFDAQKERDREKSFERLDKYKEKASQLDAGAQEAWKRLTGYHKTYDQVPNEFEPGKTRDRKAAVYDFSEQRWTDYTNNPEVYDLMQEKKYEENKAIKQNGVGKPIAPEFDNRLSESFRKQLINNKSLAPGEDLEADQRMYSHSEWDKYVRLKEKYKKQNKKFYGSEGDFDDELVKHSNAEFPKKDKTYKAYSDAYAKYADGKGPKPEFTDAVKASREKYERKKWSWTNTERKARGLPPISWEDWTNPTMGFDEDASGFGFGFGDGGSNRVSDNTFRVDVRRSAPKPGITLRAPTISKGGFTPNVKKPTITQKASKV